MGFASPKPKGKRVKSGLASAQFSGSGSGSVCHDSGLVLDPEPSFGGGNLLAPQFDTFVVVSKSRKISVLPVAVRDSSPVKVLI
jgi:hypothetical protein